MLEFVPSIDIGISGLFLPFPYDIKKAALRLIAESVARLFYFTGNAFPVKFLQKIS